MSRRPKVKRRRRLKPRSPDVAGGAVRYPFVALLGRPNVGKSSLFNRLVGQRVAIEEPTAGTTRDRIAALVPLEDGRTIELCDMGGVGGTGDTHDKDVNAQIDLAVEYADLILFLVDARAGLTGMDEQVARRLQKLGKPLLLVANKVESRNIELAANEFYAMGLPSDLVCVSAKEGTGTSDLVQRIQETLDEAGLTAEVPAEEGEPEEEERVLRVAIVGRRNVGKSTYVNAVFGSDRVIASEKAGTTRDAVDVRVEVDGRPVILIDTAGLRKRGRVDDQIEIISHGRAMEAVRRADVVLLLLDCLDDVSQVDKKIAGAIQDEHKSCVIVANKWDLTEERMTAEDYADYVGKVLPGLGYAPVVCISAKEGTHAASPLQVAFDLHAQSLVKVGTGMLNRAVAAAIERRRPKPKRNRMGKVFFCTQVAVNPVTLLLFVNDPQLFDRSWRRYLAGQLRQALPWDEVPVKLCFRSRDSLARKSSGLARRVKTLAGLAEKTRVLDLERQSTAELATLADDLDAEDVREALLDAFGDHEDPAPRPEAPEGETDDDGEDALE